MKRLALICLGLLILITGCNSETVEKESLSKNGNINQTISQEKKSPMPETMPDDFNFKVSFGYGEYQKNIIDTYEGTVTKDLIVKGTETANITFDLEEKRLIYDKMRELGIMGVQDLAPSNANCWKVPYNEDAWKVTIGGNTKIISWSDQHCDMTEDANELYQLRKEIFHIIESKEAYQALPEAEGGYD